MKSARSRLRSVALVTWLVCFAVLDRTAHWTPFAWAGAALVVVAFSSGALPRELVQPSRRLVALGVVGGVTMVLATRLAYATLVTLAPSVAAATRELFTLLFASGLSPAVRAALITVVASCEELVFRGLLPYTTTATTASASRAWPNGAQLSQVLLATAAYALTTAPLGSPLLMACALICGSIWAAMRVLSGSVLVPLLAHVIWDLGVLFVWPLA